MDGGTIHTDGCTKPGFRYGLTIRRTKATIEAGTAGKVVMFCKNSRCSARLVI